MCALQRGDGAGERGWRGLRRSAPPALRCAGTPRPLGRAERSGLASAHNLALPGPICLFSSAEHGAGRATFPVCPRQLGRAAHPSPTATVSRRSRAGPADSCPSIFPGTGDPLPARAGGIAAQPRNRVQDPVAHPAVASREPAASAPGRARCRTGHPSFPPQKHRVLEPLIPRKYFHQSTLFARALTSGERR